MTHPPRYHRLMQALVILCAGLYALWFSAFTCIEHERFRTGAFDLGTFDQGIWLAGHSLDQFVTVRGLPLLGDHVRVFSYLLAPLYWVWDDVRALLVVQSVVIAAGAWYVAKLAIRALPEFPFLAPVLAANYLLNPAVQNLNLDHAHPDAFAQTFILASLSYLQLGRTTAFAIAAALAMSCKEDIPLVFVALGMAMSFNHRHRKAGVVLGALAAGYFIFCMMTILPYFNGEGFFRHKDGGFLVSLSYRYDHPEWMIDHLFGAQAAHYLLQLGAPNLYLFLLSPLTLLPTIPAILANLVSDAPYMRDVAYHYHTSIIPFFYAGTICGLRKLLTPLVRRHESEDRAAMAIGARALLGWFPTVALLAASVGANLAWSRTPIREPGRIVANWTLMREEPSVAMVHALLNRIPKDAVVSADYSLVPHLSHRRRIYMFPNPFRASNWGIRDAHTHDPSDVEFVILRHVPFNPIAMQAIHDLKSGGEFRHFPGDAVDLYIRNRGSHADSQRLLDEAGGGR